MPEGPELHLASRFINRVCQGRIFGHICKSEISKNPLVLAPAERYSIEATSRGKEIKLTLQQHVSPEDLKNISSRGSKPSKMASLNILFTFGMSGKFEFQKADKLQKHSHLNLFTSDTGPPMALSFVDYRRFGKWLPGADFTCKDRGPCVLYDYQAFRENVLSNLDSSAFDKPICEVLLNQKYFNGIGNYLRAEILYRAGIPPFVSARSVLAPLAAAQEAGVKAEKPDILQLCNILPLEVVALEGSWYSDTQSREDVTDGFNNWLQCYYKDGMKNISDHNKRTIWYSGPLGPLAPKDGKTRAKKKYKKKTDDNEDKGTVEINTAKDTKKSVSRKRVKTEAEPEPERDNSKSTSKKSKMAKVKTEVKEPNVSLDSNGVIPHLTRHQMKQILEERQVMDGVSKKSSRRRKKNKDLHQLANGSQAAAVDGEGNKKSAVMVLQNGAEYLASSKSGPVVKGVETALTRRTQRGKSKR